MDDKLTVASPQGMAEVVFTPQQIELVKETICKGASDDELKLFLYVCQRTKLDPFAKQIYAIQRRTKEDGEWTTRMVIQTGIDGYRLIAKRTGDYAGQGGPWWCGPDGVWVDVWLSEDPPSAAKVDVYLRDSALTCTGIAHWSAYVQTNKDGAPAGRWAGDPAGMLAKCAEALALRKAFPQEMSGVYADVELGHADSPAEAPRVKMPQPKKPPAIEAGTKGTAEGCILEVKVSEGETSSGKKWTRYSIVTDEPQSYGTFDRKLADVATTHAGTGAVVRLSWEKKGDHLNCTGIEVVE